MRRIILNKYAISLITVMIVGIIIWFSHNKHHDDPAYCDWYAKEIANEFAKKKGKDLDLFKAIGIFDYKYAYSHRNNYLHVYYAAKTGSVKDFIIEMDLKTCKPRFSDKLDTDDPEIVGIANKLMLDNNIDLSGYEIPAISDRSKEWDIRYRKLPPSGFDEGLTVCISKKNRKAILLRDLEHFPPDWDSSEEVPEINQTGSLMKPSENSSSGNRQVDGNPAPCGTPGCRGK